MFSRIPEGKDLAVAGASIAILALACVNVAWTLEFWAEGSHALIYQTFGVCMITIEMTGLVIVSELKARSSKRRAQAWIFVFAVALGLNVITDFGAIISRSSEQVNASHRARAAYDDARTVEGEVRQEIAAHLRQLDRRGGERPAAAYHAQVQSLTTQREAYERIGQSPPRRLLDQLAAEEGFSIAAALTEARARQRSARDTIARYGQRPDGPPQYEGAATLLGSMGVRVAPEIVQSWYAILTAIVVKFVVVLGPWVLMKFASATESMREGADHVPSDVEIFRISEPPKLTSGRNGPVAFDAFERGEF